MTKFNIENLIGLIAESLEVEVEALSVDSKIGDFVEWDSLGQLAILTRINTMFPDSSIAHSSIGTKTSVKAIFEELKGLGLAE